MNSAETPPTCARHPKVQSNLRCATCDTVICPRCLVQTPVGAKCPTCATNRGGSLSRLSAFQAAALVATSLIAGAVAGAGAVWSLGLFSLFLAFLYGGFAGSMILRASGRRRGRRIEIIAGAFMVAGSLAGTVLAAAVLSGGRLPGGVLPAIAELFLPVPIGAIVIAIAVATALARIRYV